MCISFLKHASALLTLSFRKDIHIPEKYKADTSTLKETMQLFWTGSPCFRYRLKKFFSYLEEGTAKEKQIEK